MRKTGSSRKGEGYWTGAETDGGRSGGGDLIGRGGEYPGVRRSAYMVGATEDKGICWMRREYLAGTRGTSIGLKGVRREA